ncbi:helix-turn-helix domain-containing protein [Nocardioides panaciterrulae]|uniref:Helix-turn-helix domain-containing protein n=1 Tax=Nocardioides panaciterrulae TaxID=661492 RepID=A0A7Y9E798_9ACTN|nr:helix-turn-helix transcriptional regulator [Nocardioides panaciterrulae]NYD42181.1 hypothetical protein [Nocardioides panaciterrulae]
MEARALTDETLDQPGSYDDTPAEPLGLAPHPVEIRRNGGLAALLGGLASAVAIAYLARATGTGSWLDWALVVVMGVLGIAHLRAFVDARTPLLVADTQGVRIRLGRTWRGMPWGALARVEHRPRRGVLRDGRVVLVARNTDRVLEELDGSGRRQSRVAERMYGAPFAVPLALSTRVSGAGDDLTAALVRLAGGASDIVEVGPVPTAADEVAPAPEPEAPAVGRARLGRALRDPDEAVDEQDVAGEPRRWPDPRPVIARGIGVVSALLPGRRILVDEEADPAPASEAGPLAAPAAAHSEDPDMVASATPVPLREPVTAVRAEFRSDLALDVTPGAAALAPDRDDAERRGLSEARELRRPGRVNLVEETVVWSDRVRPIARAGSPVEPLVIDDFAVEPAEDPVVGPELVAARTRLGLSVDQLAERTRIRPHVIESIEVDDFAPCGGDFYARGHLRTLARVLGVDVTPLLTAYDERYADAPINPRRVFEAELATGAGGSIRGTRGGANWSVLVAAVMTLVLAWSVARLVMDSPVELTPPAPRLNGSAGPNSNVRLGDPVPVVLSTAKGGAHVVVRDGSGSVAWSGDLSLGERHVLKSVVPPVRVQSSDGSLRIKVDGHDRGALGADGQPAQDTFTVR